MSDDPVYMDFEEPHPFDDAPRPPKGKGKGKGKKPKAEKKLGIPTLPKNEVALTGDEVRAGISQRARAAVNLKLAGASYVDIAETLEFPSPEAAKREVERALAVTHSPDEWETLRLVAAARAEQMFARSSAMAAADYLVLEDGEKVPNMEKLAWHRQAGVDLMNHATITGAKAPAKIEITPDEEKLDSIVTALVQRMGHEDILDAEVLELEQLPDGPEEWNGE